MEPTTEQRQEVAEKWRTAAADLTNAADLLEAGNDRAANALVREVTALFMSVGLRAIIAGIVEDATPAPDPSSLN